MCLIESDTDRKHDTKTLIMMKRTGNYVRKTKSKQIETMTAWDTEHKIYSLSATQKP